MSVLVTGAGGFLGRHLCARLQREGLEVIAGRRDLQDLSWLREHRPEVVIHLAASLNRNMDAEAVLDTYRVNVEGTRNLLVALREAPPKMFLFAGTSDVYGALEPPFHEEMPLAPLTPYASSKAAAARLCQAWAEFPVVEARLFLLYGPGQDERFFIPQLLKKQPMDMTAGEQTRDYVWVEDAVEALWRLSQRPDLRGQAFNVCTGKETSLRQVVALAEKLVGPCPVRVGALPYRPGEIFRILGSPQKLREAVGWAPETGLEPGLQRMLER